MIKDSKLFSYFKVIGEINKIIDNSETIDEVLKRTLKLIITEFKVDDAVIWYKDDKEVLHPYYSICPLDITNKEYAPDYGVIGKVYSTQEAITIIDYKKNKQEDVDEIFKDLDITSMVVAPIALDNRKIGAIQYIKTEGSFDDEQANILQIVTDLAVVKINDSEQFNQSWEKPEVILSRKDPVSGSVEVLLHSEPPEEISLTYSLRDCFPDYQIKYTTSTASDAEYTEFSRQY